MVAIRFSNGKLDRTSVFNGVYLENEVWIDKALCAVFHGDFDKMFHSDKNFDDGAKIRNVFQKKSRQFLPGLLINESMTEKLSIRSSAISEVVRFPVLIHTILGGAPFICDSLEKSASNVTTVKPFSAAYRHITSSSQSASPTVLTCRQPAKTEGSRRVMRKEMFWSKSKRMSGELQVAFLLLGCKIKTGENITARQFGEVGHDFVKGHSLGEPSKYVVNGYSGIPDARFPKPFGGVYFDSGIAGIHSDKNFDDGAKVVKIKSCPRKKAINFGDTDIFPCGGSFFSKRYFTS